MRTEAQKRADKKYALAHKGEYAQFATYFPTAELKEINEILKQHNLSKVDFIRQAIKNLQKS